MEEEEVSKVITITLNYDLNEKRGIWGIMSADTQQINLLDVAQALAWAQWDVLTKLVEAQIEKREE